MKGDTAPHTPLHVQEGFQGQERSRQGTPAMKIRQRKSDSHCNFCNDWISHLNPQKHTNNGRTKRDMQTRKSLLTAKDTFPNLVGLLSGRVGACAPRVSWRGGSLPVPRLSLVFLTTLAPVQEFLTLRCNVTYFAGAGSGGGGRLIWWCRNFFSSSRLLRKFLTLSKTLFCNWPKSFSIQF